MSDTRTENRSGARPPDGRDGGLLRRAAVFLYLASLALLPWAWFPPFPWLHEHAQWSDAVFAAAFFLWLCEKAHYRSWPALRPFHLALVAYVGWGLVSLLVAAPDRLSGAVKLAGTAELALLSVVTADFASRPGAMKWIVRVVAATSLASAAASLLGIVLFYLGWETPLQGIYGDLTPSRWYARIQAGTYHPHLFGSYCIFASAVVAREEGLSRDWRRFVQTGVCGAALLTFSRPLLGFVAATALRRARTPGGRAAAAVIALSAAGVMVALSLWSVTLEPSAPQRSRVHFDRPSRHWYTVGSALRTLAAHPLFGTGPGTVPARYQGQEFEAHLTPLNVGATLGLPGMLAFVAIPILLWKGRRRPTDLAIWSGLAGVGIGGLAGDVEDFRHLWVLFGLAAASGGEDVPVREKNT